jgi:hypothetical protein
MKPIITKSFPAQASANEKFSEKNAGVKFAIGESSLGSILVACGDQGVRAIFLGDSAEELVRDLQAQLPETPLTTLSAEIMSHRWLLSSKLLGRPRSAIGPPGNFCALWRRRRCARPGWAPPLRVSSCLC